MTTTEYLQREIRRVELSIRRAERKPNTPPEELRALHEKLEHLQEALEAVGEHWQRVHEQREWTAGEQLTPERLFDMEGKPVFLKSPWWTEWCILSDHWENEIAGEMIGFTRGCGNTLCLLLADYDKTWTAYAYPPARIDRGAQRNGEPGRSGFYRGLRGVRQVQARRGGRRRAAAGPEPGRSPGGCSKF